MALIGAYMKDTVVFDLKRKRAAVLLLGLVSASSLIAFRPQYAAGWTGLTLGAATAGIAVWSSWASRIETELEKQGSHIR